MFAGPQAFVVCLKLELMKAGQAEITFEALPSARNLF